MRRNPDDEEDPERFVMKRGAYTPTKWPESWSESLVGFFRDFYTETWPNPIMRGRVWNDVGPCRDGVLFEVEGRSKGDSDLILHLVMLVGEPRMGCATKAMRWLTGLAEKYGLSILLVSKPMHKNGPKRLPQAKLTAWYKSLGFNVEGRGGGRGSPWMKFEPRRSNPAKPKWEAGNDEHGWYFESIKIANGLVAVVRKREKYWEVEMLFDTSIWQMRGVNAVGGRDAELFKKQAMDYQKELIGIDGWSAVTAVDNVKTKTGARKIAIEFANSKMFASESLISKDNRAKAKRDAEYAEQHKKYLRRSHAEDDVHDAERQGYMWLSKPSRNVRDRHVLVKQPEMLEVATVHFRDPRDGEDGAWIARAGKHARGFSSLNVALQAALRWVTGGPRHNPRRR